MSFAVIMGVKYFLYFKCQETEAGRNLAKAVKQICHARKKCSKLSAPTHVSATLVLLAGTLVKLLVNMTGDHTAPALLG